MPLRDLRPTRPTVLVLALVLLVIVAVLAGLRATQRDLCLRSDESSDRYIGMTVTEAEAEASTQGYFVRVVGRDGECFDTIADQRPDRVNVLVDDDEVVRAAKY